MRTPSFFLAILAVALVPAASHAEPGAWTAPGQPAQTSPPSFSLEVYDNPDAVRAYPHLEAGYQLLTEGDAPAALNAYQEALRIHPRSATAMTGIGAVLQTNGQYAEAVAYYRNALARSPDDRDALLNLAGIAGPAVSGYVLSRTEPAFADDAMPPSALAQLGVVAGWQGKYSRAIDYLRQAVTLQPDNALYRYNFGVVLDHAARYDEAAFEYRAAVDLTAEGGAADIPVIAVMLRLADLNRHAATR